MNDGTISGNSADNGGGVDVDSGTFTKSGGGTIYGDTDTTHSEGSTENTATYGKGHAVYVSGDKMRNTTVGAGEMLDSTKSGAAGGWE
jgi:hypothetical protein